MEELKILALRDLAIAHSPKASRMRADAVQYQGSIWADSGLMDALHFDFTATAVEKAAHELLQLTFMHPDAQPVDPVVWDAVEDAKVIAEKARRLETYVEMQPQIEAALLDAARLLCELADVTLPGWVDAAGVQPAPIAKRLPVADQQGNAILNWLSSNGHNPRELPAPQNGMPGIKKLCRDALTQNSATLFSSAKVFDTAWQRLRNDRKISDATQ